MNSSIGTTSIDALPSNGMSFNTDPQYKQMSQPQYSNQQQPSMQQPSQPQYSNQQPSMQQPSQPQYSNQQPSMQQPSQPQYSNQQPSMQQPPMQQYNVDTPPPSNDAVFNQTQMNQVVTGIQQASQSGMTQLPIRDVPRNQSHLVQDHQIAPNYIPSPAETNTDYISASAEGQSSQIIHYNETNKKNIYEYAFKELNTPIIIGILYFIFQLPSCRKYILKIMPDLFNTDGHPNLWGYIVNSCLFSTIYYILAKLMDKLDSINV